MAAHTAPVEWYTTVASAIELQGVRRDGCPGALVTIPLRAAQREEAYAQYHEDTHILDELGLSITGQGISGDPHKLRELAVLMGQDYHQETGFETVSRVLKREMLNAAERILRVVGAARN